MKIVILRLPSCFHCVPWQGAPLGTITKAEPKPACLGFLSLLFPDIKTLMIAPWRVATKWFYTFPAMGAEVLQLIMWVHVHGHGHFWGVWSPRKPGGALVTGSVLPRDLLETSERWNFTSTWRQSTWGQDQSFSQGYLLSGFGSCAGHREVSVTVAE